MSQVTTRYDGRRRPVARTVWLTPQASIPSSDTVQNPPIAGGTNGAAGDPAVSYDANGNATNGLTTRWIYIDNLVFIANTTDGGQTYTYPVSVPQLAGSTVPACTVDLSGLLSATGLPLAPGEGTFGNFNGFSASGSAVVTVNPLGEISVSVADAAGRTIATGVYKQSGTGAALDHRDAGPKRPPAAGFDRRGGRDRPDGRHQPGLAAGLQHDQELRRRRRPRPANLRCAE